MDLPADGFALLVLVFVLGARHGLDADHLAAIDGITRYNLNYRPRRARWCGCLFSLGHGSVVMLVALSVAALANQWQVPVWMDDLGAGISIAFLMLIGLLNLHAVLVTPRDEMVAMIGLKARLLRRLQHATHPLAIAAVGALFALSFDTLSQAVLFSVTAGGQSGVVHAALLGVAFTGGMLLADGINGVWIAHLLQRADARARAVSRLMSLGIATLSLGVAGFGLARYLRADISHWYEGRELMLGIALITSLALIYAIANRQPSPVVQ